jgi:hypothetical protein
MVTYIPSSLDDQAFRNLFTPYGNILSARIMRNKQTGEGMGYGFVRYDSAQAGKEAIEKVTGLYVVVVLLFFFLHDLPSFLFELSCLYCLASRLSSRWQTLESRSCPSSRIGKEK